MTRERGVGRARGCGRAEGQRGGEQREGQSLECVHGAISLEMECWARGFVPDGRLPPGAGVPYAAREVRVRTAARTGGTRRLPNSWSYVIRNATLECRTSRTVERKHRRSDDDRRQPPSRLAATRRCELGSFEGGPGTSGRRIDRDRAHDGGCARVAQLGSRLRRAPRFVRRARFVLHGARALAAFELGQQVVE